ncbi:hypothetical protein [Synechococcus sp. MIT S9508]|uniref:hypothetical protein n=1 Tax=Synechococcus sp. MIT S9508 TaxID=1801629 RepID=UPI0007BC122F|nr:hypothetical protein [Synechococcus sp. MIT S9508]KZR85610.1 hypothetical protein MITS9508_02819 [Synechococcus sp. MIT S9508]
MEPSSAEREINRIERELDATNPPSGKPPVKRGVGDPGKPGPAPGNRSLDAVLVTAVLLFVVAAALVFAGQLTKDQRKQLMAGSIGGAVGLLAGYGVGRFSP